MEVWCPSKSKFCKFCNQEHSLTSEFWVASDRGSCVVYNCKVYAKLYRIRNRARIAELKRHWVEQNRERNADNKAKWSHQNKERVHNMYLTYYAKNKDTIRQKGIEYRQTHAREIYLRKKHRRMNDPQCALAYSLRRRLFNALKKGQKSGSAVRDLGCTIPELKQYIESKFQPGMNWDNWGKYGWHIDHIVPLSSFDLTDREQFLKACNYTNLQPLWWLENLKKSDKVA